MKKIIVVIIVLLVVSVSTFAQDEYQGFRSQIGSSVGEGEELSYEELEIENQELFEQNELLKEQIRLLKEEVKLLKGEESQAVAEEEDYSTEIAITDWNTGKYYVQLFAFDNPEERDEALANVRTLYTRAFYTQVQIRGKTWYRIILGEFNSAQEANAAAVDAVERGLVADQSHYSNKPFCWFVESTGHARYMKMSFA